MQTATNPQTGERIYLNEQTGEWEDLVTATNPETGEKVFLQGEQWVPLEVSAPPADPGAMPAEPGTPGELPQVGQVSAPGMAETVTPAAPTFQDLFDEVEAQYAVRRATNDIENPMREKGSALDDLMIGWLGLQNAGAAAPVMAGDAYAQRRGVMLDRLADRFGLDVGGTSQAELEGTVSDLGAAVMPGIVERADRVAEIPQSEAAQEVFSAGTWGEALKGFVENPGEVTRTAVFQSLPLSAPSMIGAILGQVAGPKGAAMGAGFGGGLTELGATSAEGLMTALKQAGVDTSDKEAVKEFFTDNAEVLDPIWKEGLTRGGVIGAFDALGGYIVGNMARSVALGTRGQRVAAVPAGTGIEGTAGATGEAAASKLVDGEIVPGQVLAEAIGEAGAGGPSAVGQIAVESIRNPRNQILTENLRALADDIDRGVFTGDINEAVIEALRTPQTVENTPRQFSTPKMDVPPTVAAPVAPQVNTDVPESFVPPGGEAAPQVTPEEPVAQTPAPAQPEAPVAPQSPVAQTEPPAQPQVEPQEGQETVERPRQTVYTPDNEPIEVEEYVVEADDLLTSDREGYPQELQPRDRSSAASETQIEGIANRPIPQRLADSPETDRGAPIVGPDGAIVESGNGRVIGLRRAYERGTAEEYRQFVASRVPEAAGMTNPILIRRRVTDTDAQNFTVASNTSATMQMSAREQAKTDARQIDGDILAMYRGGQIGSAANRDMVRSFISKLPKSAQNALVTKEGGLSVDGQRRFQAALSYRAYGDEKLLTRLAENPDDDLRSVTGALTDAAPRVAQLMQGIESGRIDPDVDPRPAINALVSTLADMRSKDMDLKGFRAQQDAFAEPLSEETDAILDAFWNPAGTRMVSKKAMQDFVEEYVNLAEEQRVDQGELPGVEPKPRLTAKEVADEARRRRDGQEAAQEPADLFAQEPPGPSPDDSRQAQQRAVDGEGRAKAQDEGEALADVGAKPGRRPKGKLSPGFLKFSYTNKPSVHRAAWNDAGVDPDTARMKDLDWQIRTLSKMIEDRYGIKVTVGRRPAVVKNAVGRKVMTDKPELQSRKAIDQLLDAYATLEMLAAVMGVPHKALALPIDGKPLTLELTSQRKLQGALGMFAYGGDRRVIYMPERSNSFAHEWGHALDHWLASQVDHPLLGQMLSRSMSQEGMTPEVAFTHPHRPVTDAFTQVLISMFKGDARVGAIRLRLQIAASQTDPDGNPTPSARIAQKALDDMSDFKNIPEKYTSDYFKNAKEYDEAYQAGGYFTDPAEMFARAFEAFVGRSVARETDAPANFLTKGAWAYDDKNDQRNELTFPKGLDGMRFAVAMTRLSEAMRQTLDMPKGEVAALNPDPDLIPPFLIEGDPIREKAVKREWNAVQQVVKDIMATGRDNAVQVEEKLHRAVTRRFIHSAAGALHDIARKYDGPAKKAIDTIAMRIGKRQGYGQFTGTQWQEAMEAYALGRINRVTREAKKIWADGNIPKVEQKYVRRALLGLEDEKIGPDPNMRARAKKFASIVNRITDGVWYDLDSVGFKLGYQRGYLPFIHHKGLTDSKPDEFRAQAKKVYRLMFEREVKNQADESEQDKDINRALNLLRNDTKATPRGDRAPQPWVAPSDEKLIADWRAAKAKRNKLRKQLEEADDPKKAAEIEAKLRPAEAEEAQMREQVLDVLEDLWSDYSVEHWYVKQGVGAINDFDTMGPSTNFMQGRRFPPEAADILEDFMVSDPMELLQGYIFGAARQLHYARLFGLPVQMAEGGEVIGGDLKNMLEAARQGGVSSEDIEAIKVAVNAATGRITTDPVASRLFGKVSAYGQAALLALAPLSSLAEPLVVALRSGSMRDAGRAVLSNLHNIVSKGRRQDLYDLAMMMGMVADYTAETIIANRTSTDAISLSAQDRARISKFHQMTGLIPLTNYNRVANIPVAHHIILRLLRDSVEGKRTLNSRARDAVAGGQGKFADAELNELGISQENRQDLLDWLDGLEKGIPTQLDLLGTDGDMHDAGFLWARAIKRLTDETIQNTQKSDRAIAANNPYFAAMYSIMSFLDGFHRNIILRTLRRGVSEDAGNLSWERTWKGGANIALATMPALVLFGGHMISTMIREMLLNTAKMRDLEEDDEEYETMIGDLVEFATGADLTNSQRFILSRAASRTGLMGRYEPLVQLGTGVKYENDLTGMIAGPYNSFFLGSFQTVLETFVGRNSGNTNTSEWNAAQAAYRGVVQPAIAMSIANYFPAAGAVGKVGAAGLYYFSRYDASRGFADMAVGEKGRNYRDEGIPPPWFEMGSPR